MARMKHLFAALAVLALIAAGCGGSDEPTVGGGGVQGTLVKVDVTEFSVTPSPSSAAAGSIAFGVQNTGGIVHEFVVIQTDLAEDELPVSGNVVDEQGEGITIIDEVEEVPVGGTVNLETNLEAGAYVLICNIATHYESGMHASFEVT